VETILTETPADLDTPPDVVEAPPCCPFAGGDRLLRAYHDEEWGVPVLDSRRMWEALVLDTFSAGLSWLTVLRKRETIREAFCGFHPELVAAFSFEDRERLLADAGIVRSTSKILATMQNARAYEAMKANGEDFASFVWSIASTPGLSRAELVDALTDELRARGFRFIGPVIIHAWLQGIGVWNDHVDGCARRGELVSLAP
jgi:DNA-3-methyladenine glycosylase I